MSSDLNFGEGGWVVGALVANQLFDIQTIIFYLCSISIFFVAKIMIEMQNADHATDD